MTSARFRLYVPIIEAELLQVMREDESFNSGSIDALRILHDVVLRAMTSTFHGPEVRARIVSDCNPAFTRLCQGFTPLHWLFKSLPFASYRNLHQAQTKIERMYLDVIAERRRNGITVIMVPLKLIVLVVILLIPSPLTL